jgi:hypothetical protein
MISVIVAAATGEEIRDLVYREYYFEVGDEENSYLSTCNSAEWETIEDGSRIYIPNTEYGGLFKRLESDTKKCTVAVGGYTWRGMLQNKIIIPPSGQDYATDSGELNAVIGARVSAALPGLFIGSSVPTGVTVNYRYNRYVTLYDGLKAMLKSVGYKMQISYDQEAARVVVEAVPITDYSNQIEYSSDMNADYTMNMEATGINHLICLGQGELKNRTVVHLYVDGNGNISTTQTYFGVNEIVGVYDYAGATRADLIQSGTEQLAQEVNKNTFSIELESEKDVAIGDIVGGRDYITGMKMTAPITTKIVTWRNGFEKTEYKLSDDITVEME